MKKYIFIVCILGLLISPVKAIAIPVSYQIDGFYLYEPAGDGQYHKSNLWGSMTVDNEFERWSMFSPPGLYGHYNILDFTIGTDDGFTFSGDGAFRFEVEPNFLAQDPTNPYMLTIRSMHLYGTGDWTSWDAHGALKFYDSDGSPYEDQNVDQWTNHLAPLIKLNGFNDLGFSGPGYADTFNLTLTQVAPVPEPASLILLSTGLAAIVGIRKKYVKK